MKYLFVLCFLFASAIGYSQSFKSTSDSAQIRSAIIGFYKWYNANWKKVQSFHLYRSAGTNKDGPPYKIDWKGVNRYFSYLRKNVPFVGEDFIKSEIEYFRNADSSFKLYPEEEIVIGFDADRFTNSQEMPDWFWGLLLKKSNKWLMNIQRPTAFVTIHTFEQDPNEFYQLICIEMKKINGSWKIAKIGCLEEE